MLKLRLPEDTWNINLDSCITSEPRPCYHCHLGHVMGNGWTILSICNGQWLDHPIHLSRSNLLGCRPLQRSPRLPKAPLTTRRSTCRVSTKAHKGTVGADSFNACLSTMKEHYLAATVHC